MSPRMIVAVDCPHAECEEYWSARRGTVTRTIICHHPENEQCLCVLDPRVGGVCIWREEEPADQGEDE